jgi:hypothetical protein
MSELQITSKIAELLGKSKPGKENIRVGKNGIIVIPQSELNKKYLTGRR